MKIFFAILIAGVLLGLNIVLLKMNKNTPVPEGCENLGPDCSACGLKDCSVRSHYEHKEGETK